MPVRGRITRTLRGLWGSGRFRRNLARVERALESEARLASMFAMFNALNRGERPSGAEPLPRSRWRRSWVPRAAALLAMAAVVSAGRAPAAGSGTSGSGTSGSGHEALCSAYPARK